MNVISISTPSELNPHAWHARFLILAVSKYVFYKAPSTRSWCFLSCLTCCQALWTARCLSWWWCSCLRHWSSVLLCYLWCASPIKSSQRGWPKYPRFMGARSWWQIRIRRSMPQVRRSWIVYAKMAKCLSRPTWLRLFLWSFLGCSVHLYTHHSVRWENAPY